MDSCFIASQAAVLILPQIKFNLQLSSCVSFLVEDGALEGSGNPPQHSCLENPMDREAWKAAVQVAKS